MEIKAETVKFKFYTISDDPVTAPAAILEVVETLRREYPGKVSCSEVRLSTSPSTGFHLLGTIFNMEMEDDDR